MEPRSAHPTISFPRLIALLTVAITMSTVMIDAQISTPCTISMISSFTPCMNFITGSSGNGTATPTSDCCGTLRTLMSQSMDCACLVITASVPLQLPINRTLAISLPRACNMGGVPLQCKASGAPLPAPGPVSLGNSAPSPLSASPRVSTTFPQSESPEPETITLPPALSPPETTDSPAEFPGRRPVVTPSSAGNLPPPTTMFVLGIIMVLIKLY